MDTDTLRNILFEKYFENKDGILVSDLVSGLSFIPELWKKLHKLCEENISRFRFFDSLEMIKIAEINSKWYLILKLRIGNYVIVDMLKMKNISKEQFLNDFNEEYFVSNFKERKLRTNNDFSDYYLLREFNNPNVIVDFYNLNCNVLKLSTKLYYRIELGNAWTYFWIDFVNACAQLGFQTPDQFLYDHLFLNYDLTAARLQDAQSRVGLEKMNEIFERIKEIRIPEGIIPSDLLQQFLTQDTTQKIKSKTL